MKKKILVVDDDKVIIDLLTTLLKANDYEVIAAFSAMQALTMAHKEKPDLILLDNFMPLASGFSIMDKLKEPSENVVIPIIVITGNPSSNMRDLALELGASDFIGKPFDMDEVLNKVKRVLA